MNRTEARDAVFKLIFQNYFLNNLSELTNEYFADNPDCGEQEEYIKAVCDSISENIQIIDDEIQKHSSGWNIERISVVTLSAMRVCICEMRFLSNIPIPISISECLKIIKQYEGEEALVFANGILGSIQKRLSS